MVEMDRRSSMTLRREQEGGREGGREGGKGG